MATNKAWAPVPLTHLSGIPPQRAATSCEPPRPSPICNAGDVGPSQAAGAIGLGGTREVSRALELELGPEADDEVGVPEDDYEAVGHMQLSLKDIGGVDDFKPEKVRVRACEGG